MKLTSSQLRKIIREELQEVGLGRYHTPAHRMNMASQLVRKALRTLGGVEGAEEAKRHLSDADVAIQAVWGGQRPPI